MGKGETAGYQHFLHFTQCFLKASFTRSWKPRIIWEKVNIILDWLNGLTSLSTLFQSYHCNSSLIHIIAGVQKCLAQGHSHKSSEIDWLYGTLRHFQQYFSYNVTDSPPTHAFLKVFYNQYSPQYSFKTTGCFPTWPLSKQWTVMRQEWILLQWLSSILKENIGQARDRSCEAQTWDIRLPALHFACLYIV